MKRIFLETTRVIYDSSLSDDAIIVYTALKKIQNKDDIKYCVNSSLIAYALSADDSMKISRNLQIRIKKGLFELADNGFIKIIKDTTKNQIVDLSGISLQEHTAFAIVTDKEINSVCMISDTNSKLLRYYISLVSSIDTTIEHNGVKSFFGHMSQQYLMKISNIGSFSTCDNYNKILENNKLIYTVRVLDVQNNKNHNYYCKYQDRSTLLAYLDVLFPFGYKKKNN